MDPRLLAFQARETRFCSAAEQVFAQSSRAAVRLSSLGASFYERYAECFARFSTRLNSFDPSETSGVSFRRAGNGFSRQNFDPERNRGSAQSDVKVDAVNIDGAALASN